MRHDLMTIGFNAGVRQTRIAASATKGLAGEPVHSVATHSGGVANVTTCVVAAADTPVIGTHLFKGIASEDFKVNTAGTVVAQWTGVVRPIPNTTIIRGKAETTASVDTLSELVGVLNDYTLIDYAATGSPSSGPLYTIKDAAADTSGLEIVGGVPAKGLVDVIVDVRAMRHDVS